MCSSGSNRIMDTRKAGIDFPNGGVISGFSLRMIFKGRNSLENMLY